MRFIKIYEDSKFHENRSKKDPQNGQHFETGGKLKTLTFLCHSLPTLCQHYLHASVQANAREPETDKNTQNAEHSS